MDETNKTNVAVEKELLEELAAKVAERLESEVKKFHYAGVSDREAKPELDRKAKLVQFVKTLNEGTGSAGGFLVPEEFEREVVRYMHDYNQIRSLASVVPMSSDVKRLNTLATDPTVYIVNENSTITASDPVFGEPVLTAKKYAGVTSWTTELEEDNEVENMVGLLAERFAMKIAEKEQQEFISGTTSGSEGFLTVSGVTNVIMPVTKTAFSDITWDNLADMLVKLEELNTNEAQNAVFFMHPTVFNYLRKAKSTTNEYIVLPAPQNGVVGQAWGRPIVLVKEMPSTSAPSTKFVALSYWRNHAFIGDRRGITVRVSDQGVVGTISAIEKDVKLLQITKRTAFTTALQNGIVTLQTAAA